MLRIMVCRRMFKAFNFFGSIFHRPSQGYTSASALYVTACSFLNSLKKSIDLDDVILRLCCLYDEKHLLLLRTDSKLGSSIWVIQLLFSLVPVYQQHNLIKNTRQSGTVLKEWNLLTTIIQIFHRLDDILKSRSYIKSHTQHYMSICLNFSLLEHCGHVVNFRIEPVNRRIDQNEKSILKELHWGKLLNTNLAQQAKTLASFSEVYTERNFPSLLPELWLL